MSSFGGLYFTRGNLFLLSFSGGARAHFPRAACNRECCSIFIACSDCCACTVVFSLFFPCGRVISGIIEMIVTFFQKGKEVAIECHCSCVPVDISKHIKTYQDRAFQYGIGGFSLKLFRLAKSSAGKCENFAIVTDGQWQL